MEKKEILQKTKNLPLIISGNIAKDHQIWEGNEGNAHFKITKEILPVPKAHALYSLSVSGNESDKARLIRDFEKALGKPVIRNTRPQLPAIEFVLWEAVKVDQQRKR